MIKAPARTKLMPFFMASYMIPFVKIPLSTAHNTRQPNGVDGTHVMMVPFFDWGGSGKIDA